MTFESLFLKGKTGGKAKPKATAGKPGSKTGVKAGTKAAVAAARAAHGLLLAVLIYVSYRQSARLAKAIGPTGTIVVVRLTAFLLFCIGIQIAWSGAFQLLSTLPFSGAPAATS